MCCNRHMTHPYPPHHERLPYVGRHHYFLTFCANQRGRVFVQEAVVTLVRTQILRAACEERFEITAYCFMPDHAHLIIGGRDESSDARSFIKLAKQYSGFYFKQRNGVQLWQRYGYERVIRDEAELALTIGYILSNPVHAGLVGYPAEYPYIGSERFTVAELMEISEYERRIGSSA